MGHYKRISEPVYCSCRSSRTVSKRDCYVCRRELPERIRDKAIELLNHPGGVDTSVKNEFRYSHRREWKDVLTLLADDLQQGTNCVLRIQQHTTDDGLDGLV